MVIDVRAMVLVKRMLLVLVGRTVLVGFNREQMARTELGNFPTGKAHP